MIPKPPISCDDLRALALEAVRLEEEQTKRDHATREAAKHQTIMDQFLPIFPMLKRLPNGQYDLCGHACTVERVPLKYCLIPTSNYWGHSDNRFRITDLLSFGRYLKLVESHPEYFKRALTEPTFHEEPSIVLRWLRRLFGQA